MKMQFVLVLALASGAIAQTPVEKSWTILSGAAQDKNWERRAKAIHAVGMVTGNAKAQTMAEAALKDDRPEVRAAGADALGVMGAKGSSAKLKAIIMGNESDTSVVFAAANALYAMGDRDAYGVYYAVLTGERKSGDALLDSQMKMLKDPKALTKLGFEAGIGFIPFGGVSYKVFKMATDDQTSAVRAGAAVKLTHDPDPKSGQALAAAAKDGKWLVRAAAVGAIARRGDASLLSSVAPLLEDENEVVRFNAAAAVIQLSQRPTARAKAKAPAAKKTK
jgi:HEAT repeat protein